MTVTSYTTYVGRLQSLYAAILKDNDSVESADIEIVIYRNGFGHKVLHRIANGSELRQSFKGIISSSQWEIAPGTDVSDEIDQFFALEEFYAYTEDAFNGGKGPFSTAHWDATLAHVDFSYSRSGRSTLVQRMLFVGFTDEVHAEFSLAIDQHVLVQDRADGHFYYEWQVLSNPDVPEASGEITSDSQTLPAPELPAKARLQLHSTPAFVRGLGLIPVWLKDSGASIRRVDAWAKKFLRGVRR